MPGAYIFNGTFFSEDQPAIFPDDRSFRYGDGLFETIRIVNGAAPLWNLHMNRLMAGISTLQMTAPKFWNADSLLEQVLTLCRKNQLRNARIRITVSRGEGGILEAADPALSYTIQSWPLPEATPVFNSNGLQLCLFTEGRKSADRLSHLKSTNYLLYAMAALQARKEKCNDSIVLNHHGRIADTSIANIFWAEGDSLFTTPLSEGPVAGVMRQYLFQHLEIIEKPLTPEQLANASEIFLTNAVRGIQWVGETMGHCNHSHSHSHRIYQELVRPLFS